LNGYIHYIRKENDNIIFRFTQEENLYDEDEEYDLDATSLLYINDYIQILEYLVGYDYQKKEVDE
jgi:hypothetical protein